MAELNLVIGSRVALVVGTKAYRGTVDHDPERAPGSQWFVKLDVVEEGEPKEVQIHEIDQPKSDVGAILEGLDKIHQITKAKDGL